MSRRPDPSRRKQWAHGDLFHPGCAPIILSDDWRFERESNATRRKCAACRVWLGHQVVRRLIHDPPQAGEPVRAVQLELTVEGVRDA